MLSKSPIRILFIEDDARDAQLIKKICTEDRAFSVDFRIKPILDEALDYLQNFKADILFLDLYGQKQSGLQVFDRLHQSFPQIPIIVLSSYEDDTFALQAVRRGAQDYVVKDQINNRMMKRIIGHAIERKRAQESKREAEKQYEELYANILAGICRVNLQGRITFVSGQFCKMFEGQPQDFLNKNFSALLHPQEKDRMRGLFGKAVTNKKAGDFHEIRCLTRKNRALYVNLRSTPLKKNGKLFGFQSMVYDMTPQKLAQTDYKESEQKLASLLENLPDFVIMIDSRGSITYVNRSRPGLPSKEDLVGLSLESFIPKKDHRRFYRDIKKTFQQGVTIHSEYADSQGYFYTTRCMPVYRQEKITAAMIIARNITEAKKLEQFSDYRNKLNSLLVAISAKFINLDSRHLNRAVNQALRKIGCFLQVDRAYTFLFSDDQNIMNNTSEWCAREIASQKARLQNIPLKSFPWFIKRIKGNQVVNLLRVKDLPAQASSEKREFQRASIQSLLCVPMKAENRILGFVGFDSVLKERDWSDEVVAILQIAGDIFASAIERKETEDKLRESEQQYRMTIDAMLDAVHVVDKNLRIQLINQEFIRWNKRLGLPANIVGKYVFEVFSFLPKKIKREYREVFQSGKMLVTQEKSTLNNRSFTTETRKIPVYRKNKVVAVLTIICDITESERLQKALAFERAQLLSIFDSINEIVYVTDPKTDKILFVNKFLKETFQENPIGKICYRIFQGLDKPCPFCTNRIILKNRNQTYQWEYYNRKLQKHYMIFDRIIKWPDGRDVRFELAIDITERKKAEEALRASEAKFRMFFDYTHDWELYRDKEKNIAYINPAAERITGYEIKDFYSGRIDLRQLVYPEYKEKVEKFYKKYLMGDIINDEEFRIKNKAGYSLYLSISAQPVRDHRGSILGYRASVRDITERKEAEEALRRSETLLRTVFDNLPLWVFVKDKKSRFLLVNKKMANDYGVAPEKFINLLTEKSPAGPDEQKAFSAFVDHKVIESGKRQDIAEEPFRALDGRAHVLHTIKVPLCDDQGRIIGLVGVAEDITRRKKQERELDNYRQHLEELVDERTRELRQSERLAATGRLSASIAHEINNPLQGILTHLEIMRSGLPKNYQKQKNYDLVKANIEKIRSIVSRLLDIYKTPDQKQSQVDLNELIEKIMKLVEHQLRLKNIKLKTERASPLPAIECRPQQIHQVLLNLILNAADSMKGKRGEILVKTDQEEDRIVLTIQDNGEGIKKEHLDQIFDPFFTTKKKSGTGLGLFICQGIIREHGGQIKAKSVWGKGSTFIITLPLFLKKAA